MKARTKKLRTKHEFINVNSPNTVKEECAHPKGLEEPLVLPARVPVLQQLLDLLLRVLPLRHLLEGFRANDTLETLQLKRVTRREKVRVVDGLRARHVPCEHFHPNLLSRSA